MDNTSKVVKPINLQQVTVGFKILIKSQYNRKKLTHNRYKLAKMINALTQST